MSGTYEEGEHPAERRAGRSSVRSYEEYRRMTYPGARAGHTDEFSYGHKRDHFGTREGIYSPAANQQQEARWEDARRSQSSDEK
jgi:hypothetical protein